MITGLRRTVVLTAALVACTTGACLADPLDASLAVTINALDGSHKTGLGDAARLNFTPLPLAELTLRRGADSLHVEGLPPVTIRYGAPGAIGPLTTQLSIANLAYRRGFSGGWFAGVGQTLYNQHTTYAFTPGAIYVRRDTAPPHVYPIAGAEEQYSRVTGVRLEAGRIWTAGTTRIEAIAAGNPVMHGVQYTFVPTPSGFGTFCTGSFNGFGGGVPTCTGGNPTFADPEHASQVDLTLRAAHPVGKRGELLYGVRYLHYSARYEDEPGQLADRNVGIAPLLGYRLRL